MSNLTPKKVMDLISDLERLDSLAQVQDFVTQRISLFGFGSLAMAKIPGPGEKLENTTMLNNRPHDWTRQYFEERQADIDPVVKQIFRTANPYTWADLLKLDYRPEEKDVIFSARDHRLHFGYVVPILLLNGYKAVASFASEEKEISPNDLMALRLFTMFFHSKIRHLLAASMVRPHLTAREAECLHWVAAGKTDDEIGMILGISKKTVFQHVEKVKLKLNASSRTYAVVQGLRLGVLSL